MGQPLSRRIFARMVGEHTDAGGLGSSAHCNEPRNFCHHILALSGTKTADGLVDPKLVLSWLVNELGAGAGLAGILVPLREAGALLPQIAIAGRIHRLARRKWVWAAGAAVQGLAAVIMIMAALLLNGVWAGVVIAGALGLLALARAACSVSYKDVLGKTVGKRRRGTVMGAAAGIGSAVVVVFALLLLGDVADRKGLVLGALGVGAVGWCVAAVAMATLVEESDASTAAPDQAHPLHLIGHHPQLRRFIVARALLVGTALAPPYLVLLAANGTQRAASLGGLVLAAALAALLSSYVWGRFSDRSSRRVMVIAGALAAVSLMLALGAQWTGLGRTQPWAIPVVLFLLMLSYHGVRQGRATHLVDMAGPETRAGFTAVSNTVVGCFLLLAGAVGAAVASVSVPIVIGLFLVMSVAGAYCAAQLQEVQT